jgi:hypothetical protein
MHFFFRLYSALSFPLLTLDNVALQNRTRRDGLPQHVAWLLDRAASCAAQRPSFADSPGQNTSRAGTDGKLCGVHHLHVHVFQAVACVIPPALANRMQYTENESSHDSDRAMPCTALLVSCINLILFRSQFMLLPNEVCNSCAEACYRGRTGVPADAICAISGSSAYS